PIITIAAKGPYNISHMHFAFVEFREKVDRETVISVLDEAPRIIFVNAGDGIEALNSVLEICRDLQRPRADLWEVAVWKDILALNEDCTEAYLIYQVHNEAIVIPENIDAIRALTELETDPMKSIEKTDKSLGIVKKLL
ncbi:type II glyceraldehyde-3-phosphate dehydrogenase, partial [archaeon]